ncbi:MAG: 50S ribosomal protein L10 [Pseudomonadota bacterium]|jgi:large subunit ribosomal protein L10
MDRTEKQAELDLLIGKFTRSQVAVCADYRGLTVAKITELRRELRQAGSEGRVVRNTLARIAATKTADGAKAGELEKFLESIVGPTLVVTCENDPIAPTKVLAKFAKANADKFRVKGCWLDGAYVDAAGVDSLSKMPGREETFAMLLALINEPATRMVRLMSEPSAQVVRSIEAYRKKLGGEDSAAA